MLELPIGSRISKTIWTNLRVRSSVDIRDAAMNSRGLRAAEKGNETRHFVRLGQPPQWDLHAQNTIAEIRVPKDFLEHGRPGIPWRNSVVTPALIEEIRPDVVVIAAGGISPTLGIPGSNGANVLNHRDMKEIMAGKGLEKGGLWKRLQSRLGTMFVRYLYEPSFIRWLLRFSFPFGRRVVIIGGGFAGCELGVTLVERGKTVSIIEESKRIGYDVGLVHRWVWMRELREAGASLETEATVEEITDRCVKFGKGGATGLIEADTIVMAGGLKANTRLYDKSLSSGSVVYPIGDCAEPGKLLEATASGFLVGHQI
jgi:2,4-dienoyl-CoA reductase (NADPH2)